MTQGLESSINFDSAVDQPEFEQDEDYSLIQDEKTNIDALMTGTGQETAYLNKIGKIEKLNEDDTKKLVIDIAEGRKAANLLEKEEFAGLREMKSLQLTRQKGEESGRALVEANLRLAASIAMRYQNKGVPFWDLIQEGNLGLMHAMSTFDHTKGYQFSTWATGKIRQYVIRSFYDQGTLLPVSSTKKMGEWRSKLHGKIRALEQKLGREPTAEELADEMNFSVEKTEEVMASNQVPLSLDRPVTEDTSTTLMDLIEDVDTTHFTDGLMKRELMGSLALAFFRLPEVEEIVIDARFGLSNDGKVENLRNVAKMLSGRYVNNVSSRSKADERVSTSWASVDVRAAEAAAIENLRNDPQLREFAD